MGDNSRENGHTRRVSATVDKVETRVRNGAAPSIIRAQRDKIIALVRNGAPPTTAAVVCGVPRRTHENWLRKGRADDAPDPYRRYADDIQAAVEEYKLGEIGTIHAQGGKDWRAALALLERRFPDEFGERKRVDSRLQVQVQPMIDPAKSTVERLALLRELLAEFAPDPEDPALSETARPALELMEGEDFHEITEA